VIHPRELKVRFKEIRSAPKGELIG